MKKFNTLHTRLAVIERENIDTDQIISAQYLNTTSREGLGQWLFSNWRFEPDGKVAAQFVLNQPATCDAKVLVAGDNFGCGSSREHAPWALLDFGIEVVISSSIADIFCNNAFKNGLLAIEIESSSHQFLLNNNGQSIKINLQENYIECAGRLISFSIDSFARYCFLHGLDQFDFLLQHREQITRFEQSRGQPWS